MTNWSPRKMDAWIDENEEMNEDDPGSDIILLGRGEIKGGTGNPDVLVSFNPASCSSQLGSSFTSHTGGSYISASSSSSSASSSQSRVNKISASEQKFRKSFKRSISFSTATNTSSIISRRETSKLLSPLDTSRRKLHLELTE